MPELPEVETVVRSIRPNLAGKTIATVEPQNEWERVLETHSVVDFNDNVIGKTVTAVERRGKYIVLVLDRGYLFIHLRMTGRLLFKLTEDDKPKHLTAIINFTDSSTLYFKDYRKFGRFYYYDDLDFINHKLALSHYQKILLLSGYSQNLKSLKRQLKPLLLDQGFIAGLGNIYVDEALWFAKLHPQQSGTDVSRKKSDILHGAIQCLLQTAIENQGTTFINFYFGEGKSGNFRKQLQVFNRQGQECPRCKTTIEKMRVAQRGTHICPRCQKV